MLFLNNGLPESPGTHEILVLIDSVSSEIPEFKDKSFDELKAMLAGIQKKPSHKALKNALYDMNKHQTILYDLRVIL